MPKVLRIINRFNLGGITYNVSYLSRYMPPEFETLLIGGPEEESEQSSLFIPQSMGLKPVIIEELRRSINPLNDLKAYRRIKRIIKEFKPDIVHTHASKAGAIGRLAAISCGVPVVVHTFHGHVFNGYFSPAKTSVFKAIERYLSARSTAIVAISQIQKKELSETHKVCKPEQTHIIPLGFDLKRFCTDTDSKRFQFREKYKIEDDEIAIGIIGRLAPIKNHFLFIDSVLFAHKHTTKKIKALIIGDGEMMEQLKEYVKSRNAPDSLFVFTSWIKEVDIALAGLDLVCLTSKNEGTPVSLIEAQAAGKYIISTNVGGIKDILQPGAGVLSEPGETEQYSKNLLAAITDFETIAHLSSEIRDKTLAGFSYTRLCSDMANLYNQLLNKI